MTTFAFGIVFASNESNKVSSPTVDAGVSTGDPVYFDNNSSTWKIAALNTPFPRGVYSGSEIILAGKISISGLVAGQFYFLSNVGGLTTTETSVFIGYSLSSGILVVDIDNKNTDIIAGYAFGGEKSAAPTATSEIDKLVFSTNSTSILTSKLSSSDTNSGGVTNSDHIGYEAGGGGGGGTSKIEAVAFSSDFTFKLSETLSNSIRESAGINNKNVNAYFAAGFTTADISTVDKFIFNTGINSSSTVLQTATRDAVGNNSNIAGYLTGGIIAAIQKILFSDDSTSNVSSSLTGTKSSESQVAFDDNINFSNGYFGGSVSSSNLTRLSFTNDNTFAVISNLSTVRIDAAGFDSSSTGYIMGGRTLSPLANNIVNIDNFIFSDESRSANSSILSVAKSTWQGCED